MDTNDETKVITGRAVNQPQENDDKQQSKKKDTWKNVAAGVASGVAAGAGAMYAANAIGAENHAPDNKTEDKPDTEQTDDAKVAKTDDNTSQQDSSDASEATNKADDVHVAPAHSDDVEIADDSNSPDVQDVSDDGDVHIVGQGSVEGHDAIAVDLTGNGEADVAIIDVNDNEQVDDPDVVVDGEGHYATMGDIAQAQDDMDTDGDYGYATDDTSQSSDPTLQQADYDNSDISPDMPDYIDDAEVSGQLV